MRNEPMHQVALMLVGLGAVALIIAIKSLAADRDQPQAQAGLAPVVVTVDIVQYVSLIPVAKDENDLDDEWRPVAAPLPCVVR